MFPLAFASLLTGLVASLGTEWGLLRYYWILLKFTLTIAATILLLLHQFTAVAGAAKLVSGAVAGTLPSVGQVGTQLVGDAGLAILVLLVITTLSVYKPWGLTRHGRRRVPQRSDNETPAGLNVFLAVIGVVAVVGFVLAHLTGGHGIHGH